MCLIGVLRGVLKRVNGAVAPGVGGGGGRGGGGLWLLGIDVFKHGAKEWEVIMATKSAI